MNYPRKSVGLRSLAVDDIQCRWRFQAGAENSTLTVYGPLSGCQALQVTLFGWRDVWLAFPGPVDNQPRIIRPRFVRQAVEFGLLHGWQPEKPGGAKQIQWQEGEFKALTERTA